MVGPSPGVVLFAATALHVAVVAPAAITIGFVQVVDAYRPVTAGRVRFTDKPPAGAAALEVTVITFVLPLSGTEPAGAEIDTVGAGGATVAGQVIVAVRAAGFGPGVAVCVHVSVEFTADACGVQLKPIAGAFAPTVAGALIVRFAPPVIAKLAVLAGIEQASPSEPVPEPAVTTLTPTEPVPPVRVALAAARAAVGATLLTAPVT